MKTFRQYDSLEPITSGSFGTIYHARNSSNGTEAALKVVSKSSYNSQHHGPTLSNEPEIQKTTSHPNIIRLLEFTELPNEICLVLEWMECSLAHMIAQKDVSLSESAKKAYMQMMLKAVAYLHANSIIHRDIKPQNLLIDKSGVLKLGDFGLARRFPCTNLSSCAGTREYRAPEMLYGSTTYDSKVDVWACGCVCAEIYRNGKALFSTDSDIAQLGLITKIMGDPVADGWEEVKNLPDYGKITFLAPDDPPGITSLLKDAPTDFHALMNAFILYDPNLRIECEDALKSRFFITDPLPTTGRDLPTPVSQLLKARDR